MNNKRIKKFFLRFCAVVLIIAAIPFVLYGLFMVIVFIAFWQEAYPSKKTQYEYESRTGQMWQFNIDGHKWCDKSPEWEKCQELCNKYPESTRCVRQRMEGN